MLDTTPCYALARRMSPQESALLDRSLPISKSRLPLHMWANIASLHLVRPVGLSEFQSWWEDYNRRYPKMLADAVADLERQG
jgi:hypothetical protein